MVDVSTVPMTFNITHYGGDTLTIKVTPAAGVADGLTWNAHIKASRTTTTPDATFVITTPPAPGAPAYLVLPSNETEKLIGRRSSFRSVERTASCTRSPSTRASGTVRSATPGTIR